MLAAPQPDQIPSFLPSQSKCGCCALASLAHSRLSLSSCCLCCSDGCYKPHGRSVVIEQPTTAHVSKPKERLRSIPVHNPCSPECLHYGPSLFCPARHAIHWLWHGHFLHARHDAYDPCDPNVRCPTAGPAWFRPSGEFQFAAKNAFAHARRVVCDSRMVGHAACQGNLGCH